MAWTWSAPQRGTVAGAVAVMNGHRVLNSAIHRAAVTLGRGDAARGLSIGFAAFLTIAGAAAPNLSSTAMTAILFMTGASLVLFAAFPPSGSLLDSATTSPEATDAAPPIAPQRTAAVCLQELLITHSAASTSATDRIAFARLTAHMSHELRTPLNAILGFSEMMSNEVFGPLGSSCYATYARDIHASGISLLKSAEDALAITSLLTATEHQHRTLLTHASTAARDALQFHTTAFAANGISTCCTVDEDTEILADPQAVRQLLINLMSDATARATTGAHIAIVSRTVGCELEIGITVTGSMATAQSASESFSMLLARTLAELCGAKLATDGQNTTARFTRAAQNDFFGRSH